MDDLPPTKIIPKLENECKYIALESTFYRTLKEKKMNNYRGESKRTVKEKSLLL